ncbi:MAG TPA: Fic family protein [Rectinemataceae bacterium]|nr:Fic family protein [Rectinemataceae bacterium]
MENGTIDLPSAASDTRPFHERIFQSLTPPGSAYFAGHYRGEPYPNLMYYNVQFGGRTGVYCTDVPQVMENLRQVLEQWFPMLEILSQYQDPTIFLFNLIEYAADAFFRFTTIHPYANGNGHIGRFIVWAFLLRFRFRPINWTIDPRPYTPSDIYIQAILAYGFGNKRPLIDLILNSIGTP